MKVLFVSTNLSGVWVFEDTRTIRVFLKVSEGSPILGGILSLWWKWDHLGKLILEHGKTIDSSINTARASENDWVRAISPWQSSCWLTVLRGHDGKMRKNPVCWNLTQLVTTVCETLQYLTVYMPSNKNNKIFVNSCKVVVLPKPSPQNYFTEESHAILPGNFNLSTFSWLPTVEVLGGDAF